MYLTTLRKLNLDASRCLVIEDSFNGFSAAQAAGIATVIIAEDSQHARFRPPLAAIRLYLSCWKTSTQRRKRSNN